MQENFGGEKVWRIRTTGRLVKKTELKTTCNFDLAKAPIDSHIHNEVSRIYAAESHVIQKICEREPIIN